MSETPKTHRERAEEAWGVTARATTHMETVRLAPGVWASPSVAIARLTYPAEIVKAVRSLLFAAHTPRSYAAVLDDLRAALALYEPEEAKNG